MVTDRVLDTQSMEINVHKPNQHLSHQTISSNTSLTLRLLDDAPCVRRKLQHLITTGYKLVPNVQGYFIHQQYK